MAKHNHPGGANFSLRPFFYLQVLAAFLVSESAAVYW
jgi:hypothetical protein